jgi:hypothetical protein
LMIISAAPESWCLPTVIVSSGFAGLMYATRK